MDIQTLTQIHPDYPPLLKEISHPPTSLYIRGNLSVLSHPQVAIVGSRNPSPIGIEIAMAFAYELVKAGFTITSGLARGIDTAAHQGALKAGGQTIGVLGGGFDHFYPRANRTLADTMMAQGAVITEHPLGSAPKAAHFPQRNRIISGLSLGVLIVEAAQQSGSLITAFLALEQNREVFAIPGSLYHPQAKGCNLLIKKGHAKLVTDVRDILEELSVPYRLSEKASCPPSHKAQLDSGQKKLLECIEYEPTSPDQLIERTG